MIKYTIREAVDTDISGISKLRQRIKEYKELESDKYGLFWRSLIWNNPCQIRKSLIAIDNKGKVFAHYAVVPLRFLRDGESLMGGFVCQLMVDEDFRQEFVFPKIMLKMLREYKELGIDFVYSLSSRPEVVKAHQAFGFSKIGDIPVYARLCKLTKIMPHFIHSTAINILLKPFLAIGEKFLRIKQSDMRNVTIREIPRFERDIDHLLTQVHNHFSYSILRTSDILNWRTVDSPARKYRILTAESKGIINGYVIIRQMQMKQFSVLAIVDIMYFPDQTETGAALMNAAYKIAVDLNLDMTSCLLSPQDPFYPVLKKCGYVRTPESISLFVHEPKGAAGGLSEESLKKWHITWLDHDSI